MILSWCRIWFGNFNITAVSAGMIFDYVTVGDKETSYQIAIIMFDLCKLEFLKAVTHLMRSTFVPGAPDL